MSFGGANENFEAKPDRRAALDDWRRQARSRDRPSDLSSDDADSNKRPKLDESFELSKAPPFVSQGTTALERYRMRKQQQQGQQTLQDATATLPPHPPLTNRSTICFDDDDDEPTYPPVTTLSAGTPSFRRRTGGAVRARRNSMSAGAKTRYRASPSLSQESYGASQSQPLSQLTTASAPTPTTRKPDDFDSVEGAGLRSRVLEMQQRMEQLEKEKMVLSMSKAPLEARLRKAEDDWSKEQGRLLQEIESLKYASREADERYRDLLVKHDALQEEGKKLRFAARKAASTLNTPNVDNSAWSRQLQNDRDVADLKDKLRHSEEEIRSLQLEKVSVEKEINATNMELDSLIRSYNELQAEYDELAASSSENTEAEIKLQVLSTEHIATSAQLNAVCSDLAATKARAEASMEAKEEEHKKEIAQLQFDMSVLKTRAAKVVDDDEKSALSLEIDVEDDAVLRARIEERDRRIEELEAQLVEGEQLRRQMHNRIQELRGNIRVFVRTRPFLPGDGDNLESSIDVSPDGESLGIVDHRTGNPTEFKFDKVFPPSAGQDNVFSEVSDFVQSALDGYHVCLFSYGQTGSGKTHTMQGSGNGAMRGIIPRAVEQILNQAKVLLGQKWQFTINASFLEIYNEELRDLLVAMNGGKPAPPNGKGPKLAIKRNREGKSYVEGLNAVKIDASDSELGMQQLESVMVAAARARSVASTKMNAQSSRSHSVFMLHLNGFNEDSGTHVHGALNLCDLAGSERLDRSGAGSDIKRLKETQAINKSLSCLGDVFNALAKGASHVPYRNSKLTYLLQDCLSGDGKALMFVNLSPTLASSNESVCSLRFAQRVNVVELGKPTKHIDYGGKSRG